MDEGSEQSAEALLDAMPSATFAFDPKSLRIVLANAATVAQYGYTHAELLSMTAADLRPEQEVPAWLAALARALPANRRGGIWKHRRKDGSLLDAEIFAHDASIGGRKLRIVTAVDVTGQLDIARQLTEKQERLQAVLANTPVVIFATDAQGVFTLSEGKGLSAAGLSPGEVVGKSALELYGAIDFEDLAGKRENGAQVIARVLGGGRYAGFSALGESVYDNRIDPLFDAEGRICGLIGIATDISESRKARARATEREQRYGELFQHTSDGVFLLDVTDDGRFRYAAFNPAAGELAGIPAAEATGRFVDEVFPSIAEGLIANYRRCLALGGPLSYTESLSFPAGHRTFSTTLIPVLDDRGVCRRLIGVSRNITAQREAEAAMRESEERFRAAFATIPDAVNIGRAEDGVNVAVNPGFCRLTGWPEAEAVGVNPASLGLWRDPEVRAELLGKLAREGSVRDAEVRFRARDGREFIGLVSSQIFRAAGKAHFLTVTHDITERKRGERAQAAIYRIAEAANTSSTLQDMLREIHGILAELMPAPNFYIALHDPATQQLRFPYFVDQHGGIPEGPATPARGLTGYVLRTGQPLLLNDRQGFDALIASGEIIQVGEPSTSWVGVPLRAQDRPVGVLAAQIYDGTARYDQRHIELLTFVSSQVARAIERKQAEEALRASEQRCRALISNSSDGIMVIGADGVSLFGSAAVSRILGEGAEAPGLRILERVHPDDTAQIGKAWTEILASPGVPVTAVARVQHRDGSWRELESVVVNRLDDPAVRGVVSNFRDITDRRQMEARLMTADRMVSVGTLAAGVAHEINNPLAYMITNLEYVAEKLSGRDRDLNEALREVREGAERVRIIVRDLRTFSRGDDIKSGAVELRRVLDASCNMSWNEVRHRARLIKDYAGPLPEVLGNESRLGQVFLNLLINAAQSIPEGAADRNQIRVAARVESGQVIVEVSDTGVGIARDHLPRLFDPFFTTKPIGVGTGLGLFICRNIVTALGGELTVASEPGRGTTMRVALRPADRPAAVEAKAAAAPAQRGRVLVVDDERLIGVALLRSLPEHEVVTDTSALAALERIRGGTQFDLILCDLMMPEMTGVAFFELLEKEAPALAARVVFMTGGAFTPAAMAFLERVHNPRLEKPLDIDQIRSLIAAQLKAASPS